MNFSSDSIKHESKNQNEDFYIDLETPRGHFFAVIDFDTHDFANLNATLKGKLETIVNSFVSISRFSADLFLGFLAKEINNFLHNLREQAGGPQLVASAALCLLSGNRLTYLVFGSVGITIHNSGRLSALQTGQSAGNQLQRLGRKVQEAPLTEEVQTLTLEDDDVVLIMTEGVASVVDSQILDNRLANVSSSDASAIRDALMQASVGGKYDRTVLVIAGPYERYVDPVLFDLSRAVAALEARVDEMGKGAPQANVVTVSSPQDDEAARRMEDRLISRIEVLRDDLRDKAGSIDLLELDEKVKGFAAVLAGKADKADVLSVQSDLLKLSVAADVPPEAPRVATDESETSPAYGSKERDAKWQRSFLMKVAGIVLVIGFGSAFAGAWLQSRLLKRTADTAAPASVVPALPVTQPSPTPAVQPAPTPAEIAIKPGDSLRKLAQQYNVPEQAIMDLNPTVTKWGAIQAGQKIMVPATEVAVASPQTQNATSVAPGTIEVVVGPGDSINRFAQRYGTTPERIRELNPQITNWSSIRTGQKVLLPSPPSG